MYTEPEPRWLNTSSEVLQADSVTVTVEWESSSGGHTDFYITVTPPVANGLPSTVTTNKTIYSLTIPYNINYTISVIGSNCVGNSSELSKTFSFSKVTTHMDSMLW